jgi:PPOX class probable F420-dependent enzyme
MVGAMAVPRPRTPNKYEGKQKMASLLDLTKERDTHIDHHLRKHAIVWLISVRPDGRPHAVAVWFLWDGESFLIFSRPNNQKIRNLQHNVHVLLAVDDTHQGADPITIEGTATLLEPGKFDATLPAFVEKYGDRLKHVGSTPEQMAQEYSQAIWITPTRVV